MLFDMLTYESNLYGWIYYRPKLSNHCMETGSTL